jgi:hypothetical protein
LSAHLHIGRSKLGLGGLAAGAPVGKLAGVLVVQTVQLRPSVNPLLASHTQKKILEPDGPKKDPLS